MDYYDAALKRFKADTRSLRSLQDEMKIPEETLRDIKRGTVKSPRLITVKKIAKFYFPDLVRA